MEKSINKVIDLLYLARQDGVEVIVNEERLQLKVADNRKIDDKLLSEIRKNKQLLIDYLSNDQWKVKNITATNKIAPFNRDTVDLIPLSFSQERLWFINQLAGSQQYHLPAVVRLTGRLNQQALSGAISYIIDRHEVLRTVIHEKDGKPYQVIKDSRDWQLQVVDGSIYYQDDESLQQYLQRSIDLPFDLAKDYPIRATLIRLRELEHLLVVVVHHIASDAWSTAILVREVALCYDAFSGGQNPSLPALPFQYADFAYWQRSFLQPALLDEKLNYWQHKLNDLQPLQLPTDFARPALLTSQGNDYFFSIDEHLSGRLRELSSQQGTTLFMTLLAVFKVLLYRYSHQRDICVGTSIASRQQKELESLIGFFVNTLALRDELDPEGSFLQLLQQVKTTTLQAYEYQQVPFEKVVEAVVKEREPGRSPLFQVMLVLANTHQAESLRLGELQLMHEGLQQHNAKFEITFFVSDTPQGLKVTVQYNTQLYSHATIARMAGHFGHLLQAVVLDPQQAVARLTMLSSTEEHEWLHHFNSSQVTYPTHKSITELFEEQEEKTPDATALVYEQCSLTYHQLNLLANKLAHYLQNKGVQADIPVGLYMHRSELTLIAMLGILKSGACYLPIDNDIPEERISYMLRDAGVKIMLSSSGTRLPDLPVGVEIVLVDDYIIGTQPADNLVRKPMAHHLAYVIYTSGSTGRPKGVMIEHRSLADYYYGLVKSIHIEECRSFALSSSPATDLGNTVIYASLLSGATLHVLSKESLGKAAQLRTYFHRHSIDCLKIVPSHWQALCGEEETLLLPKKLLVFGGETLKAELVEQISLLKSPCRIVNHYGPTETTIGKLLHEVAPAIHYDHAIPIGRPFSNTRVYVLSPSMQPCPAGVSGQLYIAGDGLARGYLNNEELTEQKFVRNPFDQQSSLMYATGDLVKWSADGNLYFIGRADNQVKIRGYRVEPGEVETVLEQSDQVNQAAVLTVLDGQGQNGLTAFIVPRPNYNRQTLLSYLKKKLPDYMVPSSIAELPSLPLTTNGKINRKALAAWQQPISRVSENKYRAPCNATEASLVDIWQEVLEVEQVGVEDNFFELGGHSLLAVRLISAIRKKLGVELPIGDIFDFPSVEQLSKRIVQPPSELAGALPPIERVVPRPAFIPLSFSQERLWFIDQLAGSVNYHIPTVLNLKGKLDKKVLSHSMWHIIARHEVLRTVIRQQEGVVYQEVLDAAGWQLQEEEGHIYHGDKESLQNHIKKLIDQPFDLSNDYIVRATLIRILEEEHILVVTLHHIASDGYSTPIIVRELKELYQAGLENRIAELPVLPIQYVDFALWQRGHAQGEAWEKKLAYWKERLEGVNALQLPTDYPRPPVQSIRGAVSAFEVDQSMTDQLKAIGHREGATLFMTLLAAFNVLLYRYTGQQDICVGTPIAGRQHQELEGLIGFLVNTLALRSKVEAHETFRELLEQVRRTTKEAYEYQEIPFEKVVDAVAMERDMSRNPLFQVMLILQNTPQAASLQLGTVEISAGEEVSKRHDSTKFELTLIVTERKQGLHVAIEYSRDLFKEESIERMKGHFKELLHSITAEPDQSIAALRMLSSGEKIQILEKFNDTQVNYPAGESVITLFEKQVQATPHKVALHFQGVSISYEQLNQRSNKLAHYLKSFAVQEQTLIPICLERSIELVIGILGILKAGAAYVPIDADYPMERIRFILKDTGAKIVVVDRSSASYFTVQDNYKLICVDDEEVLIQPSMKLRNGFPPGNLTCVMYTSGSSGKPKGVKLHNAGIVNRLYWMWNTYPYGPDEKNAIKTSISFGDHICELFSALNKGVVSVIFRKDELLDLDSLLWKLNREKITRWVLVPSLLRAILNKLHDDSISLPYLRYWTSSGEKLSFNLAEDFYKIFPSSSHKLLNIYGSTEVTADVSCYDTSIDQRIGKDFQSLHFVPIGKPIANTRIYILDRNEQLVAQGIMGEICVSGVQVAQGYLHLAELTTKRFVRDPFIDKPDAFMFRTGDFGRWRSDGNIEYLGRIDDQVKIRGNRIELSEVESVLQQSGLVNQSVVVLREDTQGTKRLIAYFVPNDQADQAEIKEYVKGKLPEYMVPALWVKLDKLPLTSNGKVDKRSLPSFDAGELLKNHYIAPRTQLEHDLAGIWSTLLGVEKIGIHDNFFELGGDSLLTIQVVNRAKVKGYELYAKDIFLHQTIAGISSALSQPSSTREEQASLADQLKGNIQAKESERKNNFRYLVPLKTLGTKIPLYIVAGGGATANKFMQFAVMMHPDQPVYALQAPVDAKNLNEFPDTIETIAAAYVQEVIQNNPNGPYALSGHCIGGFIALEMARQLQMSGRKVHRLAVFDTIIGIKQKAVKATFKNLYRIPAHVNRIVSKILLKIDFEAFLLMRHARVSLEYKLESLTNLVNKLTGMASDKGLKYTGSEIFDETSRIYVEARKKYNITPYNGEVIVFYAKDHYYFNDAENNIRYKVLTLNDQTKNLWQQFATTIKVHNVNGDHSNMFEAKQGDEFALQLQEYVDEIDSRKKK